MFVDVVQNWSIRCVGCSFTGFYSQFISEECHVNVFVANKYKCGLECDVISSGRCVLTFQAN